jgi:hypothetical protein
MPWTLETADSSTPKTIALTPGRTVTVGRTPQATVCFPEDEWMSSLHFAVFVSGGSLQIQNLSQTNGTLVNDARTDAARLARGDRVTAGHRTFVVGGPAAYPYPAKARFGGWGLAEVPPDWQPVEGAGYRLADENQFHATVTAVEEPLPEGKTLAEYVDAQASLIRSQLPEAKLEGPVTAKVRGAEAALALTVTTAIENGSVIQRQIYAACRGIAGIFTATVLDRQEASLRNILGSVVAGLSYFQD